MPVLEDTSKLEKIYLPSTEKEEKEEDRGWVRLRDYVPAGVIIDHKDSNMEVASLHALVSSILEWNFTDEKGTTLPVTVENVRKLKLPDYTFLITKVDFSKGLSKEIKKKSDSLPVSDKGREKVADTPTPKT